MRFWAQAVKLSPSVSYRFIVNDKEVTSGEVIASSVTYLLPWQLRTMIELLENFKRHWGNVSMSLRGTKSAMTRRQGLWR